MRDDKSVKIAKNTYEDIKRLAKTEGRLKKAIITRAVNLYKEKGGDNAGDSTR